MTSAIKYIVAATAFGASSAMAAPLWQNVSTGMTWQQLSAARPNARPMPQELKRVYVIHCTHIDDETKLVGQRFDVCYDLRSGSVDAIILHNGELSADPFPNAKTEFVRRYGKPDIDECTRTSIGLNCRAVFKTSSAWIRVNSLYMSILDRYVLNIRYARPGDTIVGN